jgi:hypothetical protein
MAIGTPTNLLVARAAPNGRQSSFLGQCVLETVRAHKGSWPGPGDAGSRRMVAMAAEDSDHAKIAQGDRRHREHDATAVGPVNAHRHPKLSWSSHRFRQ